MAQVAPTDAVRKSTIGKAEAPPAPGGVDKDKEKENRDSVADLAKKERKEQEKLDKEKKKAERHKLPSLTEAQDYLKEIIVKKVFNPCPCLPASCPYRRACYMISLVVILLSLLILADVLCRIFISKEPYGDTLFRCKNATVCGDDDCTFNATVSPSKCERVYLGMQIVAGLYSGLTFATGVLIMVADCTDSLCLTAVCAALLVIDLALFITKEALNFSPTPLILSMGEAYGYQISLQLGVQHKPTDDYTYLHIGISIVVLLHSVLFIYFTLCMVGFYTILATERDALLSHMGPMSAMSIDAGALGGGTSASNLTSEGPPPPPPPASTGASGTTPASGAASASIGGTTTTTSSTVQSSSAQMPWGSQQNNPPLPAPSPRRPRERERRKKKKRKSRMSRASRSSRKSRRRL